MSLSTLSRYVGSSKRSKSLPPVRSADFPRHGNLIHRDAKASPSATNRELDSSSRISKDSHEVIVDPVGLERRRAVAIEEMDLLGFLRQPGSNRGLIILKGVSLRREHSLERAVALHSDMPDGRRQMQNDERIDEPLPNGEMQPGSGA
jgi:hypothetical protein